MIGKPSEALLGNVLTLDGSGSASSTGKPVTYSWSLQSKPSSSKATLLDATSAKPRFVMDVAGDYAIRLVVKDDGKDSEPADLTITPVIPAPSGPLAKFALIETASFSTADRHTVNSSIQICNFNRSAANFPEFFNLPFNLFESCFGPTPDFEALSRGEGSFYLTPGAFLRILTGPQDYFVGTPGTFPADAPASPVRLSYEIGTDIVPIARIPVEKSSGTAVRYGFDGPGSFYSGPPNPRNKVTYRVIGSSIPQNAPKGWKAQVETTVEIKLTMYVNLQVTRELTVYSKRFTSEFDENIEFDPNPPNPSNPAPEQSTMRVSVTHKMALSRIEN